MRRERPLMTAKTSPTNTSFDEISIRLSRGRDSLSEDLDFQGYASSYRSSDFCMDGLDHTIVNDSPRSQISSQNVSKYFFTHICLLPFSWKFVLFLIY